MSFNQIENLQQAIRTTKTLIDRLSVGAGRRIQLQERVADLQQQLDRLTAPPIKQPAGNREKTGGSKQFPSEHDRRMASLKTSDPAKFPSMNARELAAYLGISNKTAYELEGLVEMPTRTRKRLWTTESVIALKNLPPK
jgi:hypothetical protein